MRDFWETISFRGGIGGGNSSGELMLCAFWIERIKTKHRRGFAVQLRTLGVEVRLCARSPMASGLVAGASLALNYLC